MAVLSITPMSRSLIRSAFSLSLLAPFLFSFSLSHSAPASRTPPGACAAVAVPCTINPNPTAPNVNSVGVLVTFRLKLDVWIAGDALYLSYFSQVLMPVCVFYVLV